MSTEGYLARALAENPEVTEVADYTWYLVPCSDPDAARLNEGFTQQRRVRQEATEVKIENKNRM